VTRDTFDVLSENNGRDRGRFGDNEQRRDRPRVTGASDLVDFNMVQHVDKDRPKAVLVSFGDRRNAVWLPLSQAEVFELAALERKRGGYIDQLVRVTLPKWLAREKGLLK